MIQKDSDLDFQISKKLIIKFKMFCNLFTHRYKILINWYTFRKDSGFLFFFQFAQFCWMIFWGCSTCLIKSRVKLLISINPLYVKLDRNLGRKKAVLVPVPSLILFLIKLNWDRDTAASLLDKVSMKGVESIPPFCTWLFPEV